MLFFSAKPLWNLALTNVSLYVFDKYNYFLLSKIAPDVGQIIDAEHGHTRFASRTISTLQYHFAVLYDLRGGNESVLQTQFLLTQISQDPTNIENNKERKW